VRFAISACYEGVRNAADNSRVKIVFAAGGVARPVATWIIVAYLAVQLCRIVVRLLSEALRLRSDWIERPR